MKILVIPDIHENYKDALENIKNNKDQVDKVVVLGDYVDSFEDKLNGPNMINGFNELCLMKRKEPNKFNIILGNHDLSYISNTRDGERVSGHQYKYAEQYRTMFENNLDILDICCKYDDIIFSHAGISRTWYRRIIEKYNSNNSFSFVPKKLVKKINSISKKLNNINHYYFNDEIFSLVNVTNDEEKAKVDKYRAIQCDLNKQLQEAYLEAEKYYKDTLSLKKSPVTNLNRIFHSKFNDEDPCSSYYFEHCGWSPSGDSSGESCTWIRPYSLLFDDWPRCKMQVVGHTEVGEKYFSYNNKKLMILDSHSHNLFKIIDTEKLNELKFIDVSLDILGSLSI